MGTWNDTDEPIAYLITFRTYGTWLPGDSRGSIDRFHNVFSSPRAPSNIVREQQSARKLKGEPVILDSQRRSSVESAIREVCGHRGWMLFALNVRTNHVHAVTSAQASSGRVLGDLKSYSTRRMRCDKNWTEDHSPWVDKGSKRNLWNSDHIWHACEYVVNGQGDELPRFE